VHRAENGLHAAAGACILPHVRKQEMLILMLVLAGVAALYASAGVILARSLFRRLARRQRGPASRAGRWLRRGVLGLAGLGVLCMAYGYFVEPYWLEVTHVRITTAKLPPGSEPIRIMHVSDLHCDAKVRLEEKLPAVVAAEKPDLIVFTGDAVNSLDGVKHFRRCMRGLSRIAPTFAVKGNWDVWYHSDAGLFEDTGAIELDGGSVQLPLGGAKVWIGGLAPGKSSRRITELLAGAPDDAVKIFLYHYPGQVHEAAEGAADLYLCGHTHGGQIALPLYGALVTLSKYGKRFEAGLYQVDATRMYVNRGIGMEGVMPMRFFARPEVTVIEIAPAKATPREEPARPRQADR